MTAGPTNLSKTQAEIDELRRHFEQGFGELVLALPFNGTNLVGRAILAACEEFGIDKTLERVAKNPANFSLSAALPSTIEPLLVTLLDQSQTLDLLIAERESLLSDKNPYHQQRYSMQGREFVLNFKAQQIVYQDTHETEPLDPVLCALELGEPPRNKRRSRSRDR